MGRKSFKSLVPEQLVKRDKSQTNICDCENVEAQKDRQAFGMLNFKAFSPEETSQYLITTLSVPSIKTLKQNSDSLTKLA